MRSLMLMALFAPSVVHAATLEVGPSRTYGQIQDAIDAASDGDTIRVYADDYFEQLTIAKDLTIEGVSGSGSTDLRWEDGTIVTITGATVSFSGFHLLDSARGFAIDDSHVVMEDLQIDGMDTGGSGGGMRIENGSIVTLTDAELDENNADEDGGHVYVDGSSFTAIDVRFTAGQATSGGGLFASASTVSLDGVRFEENDADWLGGGVYAGTLSSLTIADSRLEQNQASSGGGLYATDAGTKVVLAGVEIADNDATSGGGVYADSAAITSSGSQIRNHSSSSHGPGVRLEGSGSWDGVGDEITGNATTTGYGGGLYIAGTATATLDDARLQSNRAARGGGVYHASAGLLAVERSELSENTASGDGGALYAGDGLVSVLASDLSDNAAANGGAAALAGADAVTWQNNLVCANRATGAGGGLYSSAAGAYVWNNNVFAENTAGTNGGGVYVGGSVAPKVVNDTWIGNSATVDGGAAYLNGVSATIGNTIVASSTGNGVGADALASSRSYTFGYNDFFANTAANFGGGLASFTLDGTNLTADPELTEWSKDGDCGNDRFWPRYGSPVIDAGDPSLKDPDGSRSDIGAYGGPSADASLFEDADGDGLIGMFDCDDGDGTVTTPSTWYGDADGDGYGGTTLTVEACEQPDGYYATADDCDDTSTLFHPDAPESCTEAIDYNCDGSVGTTDADGDGTIACEDCDDADGSRHPGANEHCNGLDDDCDGVTDEADAVDAVIWYADADEDGWGDDLESAVACDAPDGFVDQGGDCNDDDDRFHPGAEESCDVAVDFNCDGFAGTADNDGDGVAACEDCDDGSVDAFPGADELCDGTDNDCDGDVDEDGALYGTTWHPDADGDGYGDGSSQVVDCDQPQGYVDDNSDCDDADASVHPGADDEPGDNVDADCDGQDGGDVSVDKGGCNCDSSTAPRGTWTALLGLMGLLGLRRRTA